MSTFRLLALAPALFVHLACQGDDRPPIVWEGDTVRFGTSEDPGQLCGGTLTYLDQYAGYLREKLGGPNDRVNFYWIPDDAQRAQWCSIVACTNARSVFSAVAPDEHELVHAIHYRDRVAARAIEEGFAELYGDDADIRPAVAGNIEDLLRNDPGAPIPAGYYPLAGHFVSFLATELGEEKLEQFAVASNLRDSYEQTEATFMQVYGQSLGTVLETYESSYAVCDQLSYRDNGFDCSAEATAISAMGTTLSVPLDCSNDRVIGPRYGERWTKRLVEVAEPGQYRVTVGKNGGDRAARVRMTRCGVGCDDDAQAPAVATISAPVGSAMAATACLSASRYVVRVALAADDSGSVDIALEPLGEACSP